MFTLCPSQPRPANPKNPENPPPESRFEIEKNKKKIFLKKKFRNQFHFSEKSLSQNPEFIF